MKERKSNKANDMAAIERRKQKQAAQQQFSNQIGDPIHAEKENNRNFSSYKMTHLPGVETQSQNRLAPRNTAGAHLRQGH